MIRNIDLTTVTLNHIGRIFGHMLLVAAFAALGACDSPTEEEYIVDYEGIVLEQSGALFDTIDIEESISIPGAATLVEWPSTDNAATPRIAFDNYRAAAAERLAKIIARALRDASARVSLYDAMSASSVKEGKLHLGKHLQSEENRGLLAAMQKEGAGSENEISRLLTETGALELYLPVAAHREQWRGDENVIVAVQLDEQALPYGFDLHGQPVKLSLNAPPAVPTISIVPAESFTGDGTPREDHVSKLSSPATSMLNSTPGLWVTEVHVPGDYEAWLRGNPEFEMHLQNANTRQNMNCAGAESVAPYYWDMNENVHYQDFLLAAEFDLPRNTPVIVALWEDDDTVCVTKADKDYVKMATDALLNASGVNKAIMVLDDTGARVNLYNLLIIIKSFFGSEDEFVGVIAGTQPFGAIPVTLNLKNVNMSNTGSVNFKWTGN